MKFFFSRLELYKNLQGVFGKLLKKGGRFLQKTGGAWITKPFTNWKKATQKMKSNPKSEMLILSYQLEVEADRTRKEGSIITQLQNVGEQHILQNGKADKALIQSTRLLAHAQSTYY